MINYALQLFNNATAFTLYVEPVFPSYTAPSLQTIIQKSYINFSDGSELVNVAPRTGGREFWASDYRGVAGFATFAAQTSSEGCDAGSGDNPVYPTQLFQLLKCS